MKHAKKTVVVAMSGGVDSSVAAAMLLEEGYDVIGVTLQIWQESTTQTRGAGCCSLGAVEDARRVATKIGIPHYVLNYREYFSQKVIGNFIEEYKRGRTPNPCINCNRYVKFDALLEKARQLGADYLATGHYARISYDESRGRYILARAHDRHKDQTYALYHFTQHQLEHTMMPLGEVLSKDETRAKAAQLGLAVADKPDSQEICFVQGGSYTDFLAEKAPETLRPGKIVDTSGKTLGDHDGIAFYTIGQRKRINVGSALPLYVLGIDSERNQVLVGDDAGLLTKGLVADDLNWVALAHGPGNRRAAAKIRYNMQASDCSVRVVDSTGKANVEFDIPQRAVTPGQSIVFYEGDVVLGGGTIQAGL